MFDGLISHIELGSVADFLSAGVAFWGLYIANKHFNQQPRKKLNIYYDSYQVDNSPKYYRFWVVNEGNVSVTVRWLGIRKSTDRNIYDEPYQYTIGEDQSWILLKPGEASKPMSISVIRISQIIKRRMEPGDTGFIDVAFIDAQDTPIEIKGQNKVKITTTMVRDNSGLPKAPNDGKVKFKHANEVGINYPEGNSQFHGHDGK